MIKCAISEKDEITVESTELKRDFQGKLREKDWSVVESHQSEHRTLELCEERICRLIQMQDEINVELLNFLLCV